MEDVRKQEKEVLEAQSVPLRNYLMKYVMPTLTSALIDVCKVRPEDPVDYVVCIPGFYRSKDTDDNCRPTFCSSIILLMHRFEGGDV